MAVCPELALPSLQAESMDAGGTGTRLGHMPRHTFPLDPSRSISQGPTLGDQNTSLAAQVSTCLHLEDDCSQSGSCRSSVEPPRHEPPALSSARLSGSCYPAAHPGLGTHGQDRTDNNKP